LLSNHFSTQIARSFHERSRDPKYDPSGEREPLKSIRAGRNNEAGQEYKKEPARNTLESVS
jgi:hypothetical protein